MWCDKIAAGLYVGLVGVPGILADLLMPLIRLLPMAFVDLENAKRIRDNNKARDNKAKARRLKARKPVVYKEIPISYAPKPKTPVIAWRTNPPLYTKEMKADFYQTREWRSLRWRVLSNSDGRCAMCGTNKEAGSIMHIDHIMPRSKFPSKELDINNLQVLCAECNIGKGAKY